MKRKNNFKNISKKIIKKAKGITLISLVITIIILLILAGVTLSLTLGDTGIITQAQNAKEAGEIAAIKEDLQLAILGKELEKGGAGLTQEELEEIASNYGELQEDGNTLITDDGHEIKIDEIYKPGEPSETDKTIAELEENIKNLEQTIEDLKNKQATGDATVEQVLEGATFSNSSEIGLTGTMANRGTLNWNPSSSTSYTVEPGYYSGGTLSTSEAYNAGVSEGGTSTKNNVTYVNIQTSVTTTTSNKAPTFSVSIPSGRTKCYGFLSAWYYNYGTIQNVSINGLSNIRTTSVGNGHTVSLVSGNISSGGGTLTGVVQCSALKTINVNGILVLY